LGWTPEAARICTGAALTLIFLAPPPQQIQKPHTSARHTGEERVKNSRQIQTADFR
jgi:hypothetical protein